MSDFDENLGFSRKSQIFAKISDFHENLDENPYIYFSVYLLENVISFGHRVSLNQKNKQKRIKLNETINEGGILWGEREASTP